MKYVQAQRLLQNIKKNRWRYFCFPKRLHVLYRLFPDLYEQGAFEISFLYKNRHFVVSIGCKENEKLDYKFFTTAFFSAYKRLKYKIRHGIRPPTNTDGWGEKI